MIPVIALVGRPNVGKSTLFNTLTRTRDALVANIPGLTRDRQYGRGCCQDREFIVVDTGGLENPKALDGMSQQVCEQTWQAIADADIVCFLLDGKVGVTVDDLQFAQQLRRNHPWVQLVVNKVDHVEESTEATILADFYRLGLGIPQAISAIQNRGIDEMISKSLVDWQQQFTESDRASLLPNQENIKCSYKGIKVAIVGRPNVGKSTLVNRFLGEDRMVVSDIPGTTRDRVSVPFVFDRQEFTLIDTAGIRRKAKVTQLEEKFSVVKTLQTIEEADVMIVLLNAQEGLVIQDLHLLSYILEAGRALIIGCNQWDALDEYQRKTFKSELERRLGFVDFAPLYFISGLKGKGIQSLFKAVQVVYESAAKTVKTGQLTQILQAALAKHAPPLVNGRRIKLRYVHMGGHFPPTLIIHGNQTERIPINYQRYLTHYFYRALNLTGTPLRLAFKSSENPFANRVNQLTARQMKKRGRIRGRS